MNVSRIYSVKSVEGKAPELGDFLLELGRDMSIADGCEGFTCFQDTVDKNSYMVIELWRDEQAHKASAKVFPKEKMAAAKPLFADVGKSNYWKDLK